MPSTKYNGVCRHPPWLLAALLLGLAAPAGAQRVLGPWEDATTAPRGILRAGIATEWSRANERFARESGRLEPLGADFARDTLGPFEIEALAGLGPQLATLSGLASVPVTLGGLQVQLERMAYTTNVTLEFGVTSRLSIGAVVPYVKNRIEVFSHPNPGLTGNVGVNPALAIAGARTQNTLVVSELAAASLALQNELSRCLGSTDPTCGAINANRPAAEALVQTAGSMAGSLAGVYGSDVVPGSPFVPVAGSSVETAVNTRLTSLSDQFTALLGTAPAGQWVTSRPVPAAPLALTDFQRVLMDSSFGIVGRPLADVERSHLGDVAIGAKLVLLEPGGRTGTEPPTRGLRLAVAALYRLPTAQLDLPEDFADVATGDAQPDLELRGFMDLLAGRRFWASAVVRYGIQMERRDSLRITDAPGMPFPALFRAQQVDRDLGEFVELEFAPRWVPNDALAVSANYRYRSKAADTYGGYQASATGPSGMTVPLDAATLGLGTAQEEHRYGIGITFSTLRAYARRRSRWPMEVSLLYTQLMGGEGVPKAFATTVAFRFYRRLFGSNPLRGS